MGSTALKYTVYSEPGESSISGHILYLAERNIRTDITDNYCEECKIIFPKMENLQIELTSVQLEKLKAAEVLEMD